jgi:hypothetical protein
MMDAGKLMPAASASMPMPSYGNCVLSAFVRTGCFEDGEGAGGREDLGGY